MSVGRGVLLSHTPLVLGDTNPLQRCSQPQPLLCSSLLVETPSSCCPHALLTYGLLVQL